jgi:hypothetical protein
MGKDRRELEKQLKEELERIRADPANDGTLLGTGGAVDEFLRVNYALDTLLEKLCPGEQDRVGFATALRSYFAIKGVTPAQLDRMTGPEVEGIFRRDLGSRGREASRKGIGGRKRLDRKETVRRTKIIQAWEAAKGAGIRQKEFCHDQHVTMRELGKIVAWDSQRKRRKRDALTEP